MTEDPAHVDVRLARLAAAIGGVAWIVVAMLLRSVLGPVVLVAVSIIGLPLTALWAITVVELGHRARLA